MKSGKDASNIISIHASHNPNLSSVRGIENAQIRNTIKAGKFAPVKLSLDRYKHLFGKTDYSKKSNYDRLLVQILAILLTDGRNKKACYSFPYKHRDTKAGNIISLARRIRTALKAKYINMEKLEQIELHKTERTATKGEIQALRFSEQYIK